MSRSLHGFCDQLTESANISEEVEDKTGDSEEQVTPDGNTEKPGYTPPPTGGGGKQVSNIVLPLSVGEFATLQAAFPMTEKNWKQMVSVLNAMKPALVSDLAPDDQTLDEG